MKIKTVGQMELRVGTETYYASSEQSAVNTFKVFNKLCGFLDSSKTATHEEYVNWFNKTVSDLYGSSFSKISSGNRLFDVVIDANRRIILYNEDKKNTIDVGTEFALTRIHNYQIFSFK